MVAIARHHYVKGQTATAGMDIGIIENEQELGIMQRRLDVLKGSGHGG